MSGTLRLSTANLLVLALICGGCKKGRETRGAGTPSPAPHSVVPQTGPVEPAITACTLITTEEVSAIQKATIIDAKSSAGPSGNLVMSQCYYGSKEPNMSVSLVVIQPGFENAAGTEVRDYWTETFRRSREQSAGQAGHEGEGERRSERGAENDKKNPPKKVDGVGEEAYWSGNRFGGALYVLRTDVIIRVSVGGPDNEETKITKSKTLAQEALKRLP
jgi:hypothetical protein